MKVKLSLLLVALLISLNSLCAETVDWKSQAMEAASKYQQQKEEKQKETVKRIKAEKELEIQEEKCKVKLEKEKSKNGVGKYLFEVPIINWLGWHVGVTDEEVKGAAWGALAAGTGQPVFLLGLLF